MSGIPTGTIPIDVLFDALRALAQAQSALTGVSSNANAFQVAIACAKAAGGLSGALSVAFEVVQVDPTRRSA